MTSPIHISAHRRLAAMIAGAALVLGGGAVVTAAAPLAYAQTSCSAEFSANEWGDGSGGFTGNITISSSGVNGWQLTFTLPGNAQVIQGWNADWTQSGQSVSASNLSWNANLGSASIGFNGSGYAGAPTSFTLNGVACNGGSNPPPPPPPNPQPPPPPPPNPQPPPPPPPNPQPPPPPPPNPQPPPPPTGQCGSGTGDAEVIQNGGSYTATNGGSTVHSGSYLSAINAALNSLNRPQQQRVVVRANGDIGGSSINLPSNTTFEVCGTITASNNSGNGAVQSINASNVSIPYLTLRGTPYFGLRFAGQSNLHLGDLDIRLNNAGIGIRFERDLAGSNNVTIDKVYVSGTSSHGVETWHVDGLTIGTITARNTGYSGLLLNESRNVTVELVDGVDTGSGTGYATFRTANRNGRIGSSYPTNIRVGEVRSQGGGRGIFCVSESGGLVIDRISLSNNGNNSILIENCYNVTIANQSGTINGGGEVRLAARSEFANNRDVSIQNLTVTNVGLRESPCGINISWTNITRLGNSPLNVC